MKSYSMSVSEAKAKFSHMLDLVAKGDEVLITNRNLVVAKVVPIEAPRPPREFGKNVAGITSIADDFDAPLSAEELALWEADL